MIRRGLWLSVASLAVFATTAPAQVERVDNPPPKLGVRARVDFKTNDGRSYYGVVDEINETRVVLRCQANSKDPTETTYELFPIDLLAEGKRVTDMPGSLAYSWQDVKKGDTVQLGYVRDNADKKKYVYAVMIRGRPGEKLPKGHDHANDERYKSDSLLNDVDNGVDVDDKDIAEQFPAKFYRDGSVLVLATPFGLPPKYQAKLDAIREKKAKELKAPAPDKK